MKTHLKSTLALLAFTLSAGVVRAAPTDFLGTWKNVDSATKGIVQVVITPGLQIRNFGACTPTPCDMGSVPLVTYGKSVTDTDHAAATALYRLSFKQVVVTAKLLRKNLLLLESYNRFTDGSGRQNYMSTERLQKVSEEPITPFDFQMSEPLE